MHPRHALVSLACATILSALVACGGSDSGAGGGATTGGGGGKACGTAASPQVLTIKDVQPAAGSSVPNQAIVHAFTVVNAPGLFQSVSLLLPAGKHTAGNPDPSMWSFSITQAGTDVTYTAAPVAWQTAPGDVYVQIPEPFKTDDGCFYALPDPVFSYSIVPGGTGGAGGAGAGGADAGP